ncbi:Fc.00g110440.m01.CDS01 [Cosmosporella sp. VM-42]
MAYRLVANLNGLTPTWGINHSPGTPPPEALLKSDANSVKDYTPNADCRSYCGSFWGSFDAVHEAVKEAANDRKVNYAVIDRHTITITFDSVKEAVAEEARGTTGSVFEGEDKFTDEGEENASPADELGFINKAGFSKYQEGIQSDEAFRPSNGSLTAGILSSRVGEVFSPLALESAISCFSPALSFYSLSCMDFGGLYLHWVAS